MHLLNIALLASIVAGYLTHQHYPGREICTLYPESLRHQGEAVDDVPFIEEAFRRCGKNAEIVFTNNTFNIGSVMNTTGLVNVDVTLRGVLKFSTDIAYWRAHAFPVIFQNQSTAWFFGGENVTFRGDGGYIDGQGQVWYTFNKNGANMPGRPIVLTVVNSTNVWIDGLRIVQPMFWASFVWRSQNVSLVNYYSNATSDDQYSTTNTDGYDSWNSDTLLIENATITTDDDCVAPKGNTTNLYVKNVTCHGGAGMAIGSVGQYVDTPDYVYNVTFDGVRCLHSGDCAYIKTWQGDVLNSTTNGDGGGGGRGVVKNITFRNFELENIGLPIQISQCIYAGKGGLGCNTSQIAIEDIHWENFKGTSRYNIAASLYCSEIHPCPGVTFKNIDLVGVNQTLGLPFWNTSIQYEVYQCANLVDEKHSGIPCNREAPDFYSQGVSQKYPIGHQRRCTETP